jgi:thioredoxin-like negative regulator of GroEL
MNYTRWVASGLAIAALCLLGPAAPSAEGIPWHGTLEAALATARESGKLVLVDFYADWCEPCKMLEQQTFPAPDVVKAAEAYEAVRVDVDRRPDLAMRYAVEGIPNIVFLNAAGEPLHGIVGYYPPGPFADVLSAAARLGQQLAALKNAPDDPGANYVVAMTYLDLGRHADARPLFAKVLEAARPQGVRDPKERLQTRDLRMEAEVGYAACVAVGQQPRKGIKRLQAFLKRNPSSPHAPLAKWHIAVGYFMLEQYARTLACGEQLVRQYADSPWAERAKPLMERAGELAR